MASRVLSAIKWHWSDVSLRRTKAQEAAEECLVFGQIRFHRVMLVPAAVLVQLCIGSLYAWSVWNLPIERYTGFETGSAAMTFYIAVGCNGCGAAIFGPCLERYGPRRTLMVSSTLLFAAHLLTALSVQQKSLAGVYLSYGLLGGTSLGVSHITPVSPLQKWFPDYRGLVSGLAVAGLGGGSMAIAKIQHAFIESLNVPATFCIMGAIYYAIMFPCAFVLRQPPSDFVPPVRKGQAQAQAAAVKAPAAQAAAIELPKTTSRTDVPKSTSRHDLPHATSRPEVPKSTSRPDVPKVLSKRSVDGPVPRMLSKRAFGEEAPTLLGVPTEEHDEAMGEAKIVPNKPREVEVLQVPKIKVELFDALLTWDYRLMYFMFMCNTLAGVLTISKFADVAQLQFHRDADEASTLVSINAAFNLSGRLLIALISDYVGRKPLFVLSLCCQVAIIFATPTFISQQSFWAWVVSVWLLTAFYGGGFGLIPAFLSDMFGAQSVGALYGMILTSYSIVGVAGGFTFTAVYNQAVQRVSESVGIDLHHASKAEKEMLKSDPTVYNANYYWIGTIVLCGLLLTPFIRTGRDRLLPAKPGQRFALRVGSRLLRYSNDGLELVQQEVLEREWRDYLRSLPENQRV